ncbi:MAG: membrane dipeptidase [Pygmaiobacter massiliensis]|nr:membrane dipeptidase [Pygmaiobacter massiliensis]
MDYFDLHCDTTMRIADRRERLETASGQLSLRQASFLKRYVQVYAFFVHDRYHAGAAWQEYRRQKRYFDAQCLRLADQFSVCRTAGQLEQAVHARRRAGILAIENGAVLGGSLFRLEQAFEDGVRILTLTWRGENELGFGSAAGGRLKPFGAQVLRQCARLGIVPDISHLSSEGTADLLRLWDGPLIASHSNARAVYSTRRNLSDEQIRELARRGGLIGVSFSHSMLAPGERPATLDDICRQVMYLLEMGCEQTLAFGSDFDGAHLPADFGGVKSLPSLWRALNRRGLSHKLLQDLFFENAMRFFTKQLGGTHE